MRRTPLLCIATCAAGIEDLLADEIARLEAQPGERVAGAVPFSGSLQCAYRVCLWSRFASRVLLELAEFPAPDSDALYAGAQAIDWNRHLGVANTFAVTCTGTSPAFRSGIFVVQRVKDAVADYFQQRVYRRPSVDREQPDIRLHVHLRDDRAVLSLDLSGESLHQREYRLSAGEAPLKETLAAAILWRAGWPEAVGRSATLVDPMCGSATLLIEAARIAADCAPGLGRTSWGFSKWRGHNQALWDDVYAQARRRSRDGLQQLCAPIIGFDASATAVRAARENIARAGMEHVVRVERQELGHLCCPVDAGDGMVVVNPPYGVRMGQADEVKYLYRGLGRRLRDEFSGWRAAIFTGNTDLLDHFGMPHSAQYRMYNGALPCLLRVYEVPVQSAGERRLTVLNPSPWRHGADRELDGLLRRNAAELGEWAGAEGIDCFRLYDGDDSSCNVAIDIYGDSVVIQDYAPARADTPEQHTGRLERVREVVQDVLQVKPAQIFVKQRQRQKGPAQYRSQAGAGRFTEVCEYGCRFLIRPQGYIDTGLFLDHRIVRCRIQELAGNKRFLNLFGYTGTATVHAARGGAAHTVTVDLSPTYLDWARCNLALNGFSAERHILQRADCMAWVAECRDAFDLILLDPPTFSNTKQARRVFDVQRDHPELIRQAARLLAPGGTLIFSTNYTRFRLNGKALGGLDISDITRETMPRDFQRRTRVHQCWIITGSGRTRQHSDRGGSVRSPGKGKNRDGRRSGPAGRFKPR